MKPVIVVGGGPAGATVATLLAQDGIPVILLDRAHFPRPKPCGECLNPGAVRELRELGWADEIETLRPGLLQGWSLQAGDRRFEARFPEAEVGWGVDRVRLDALMLERARRAGVEVREGYRVTGVQTADHVDGPAVSYRVAADVRGVVSSRGAGARAPSPPMGHRDSSRLPGPDFDRDRDRDRDRDFQRVLRSASQRTSQAISRPASKPDESVLQGSIVVAADGLRSTVAASLGLRTGRSGKASCTFHVTGVDLDPRLGHLHLAPGPTVGVAPLSSAGDLWTVTVVGDSPETAPGPNPILNLRTALRAFPELESATVVSDGWMSGSFQVRVRSCTAPGVFLVGDAAGYYDPLTGQGIYRAIRMARWAAQAVRQTVTGQASSSPEHAAEYADRVAGLSNGRRLQQLIEWARRRPRLLERALAGLDIVHGLDPLIALTGDLHIRTS